MLHLSLLTLPRSSGRWRFLTSYQIHQMLWKAFSNLQRGDREKRFLYRHDENDDCHSILIQSILPPDWRHVEDEAEGTIARVKTFEPDQIGSGDMLRFFIRANPVAQRKGYSDGKSRRVVIGSTLDRVAERLGVPIEDLPSRETLQIKWVKEKGKSGGFDIEERDGAPMCMPGPSHDYVLHRARGDQKPMTFTAVDFTGLLRVTDPLAFANTLRYGIGRGKAFGFGLLSVARLSG